LSDFNRPRKRFGQHFLHDQNILAKIVHAIAPAADDRLVEIGPGRGALTLQLVRHCDRLIAVELDRDLADYLTRHEALRERVELINADALKFDFSGLSEAPRSLRIVGNLPYNISTPLLFHLLEAADQIRDMHFLLQKEVVDRLVAAPGNKDYGRLSVMIQYHCQTERLFHVPPGAFSPPPKVESSVVRLTPREQPEAIAADPRHFEKVVRQAFSQRRKTLRKSLRGLVGEAAFEQAGVAASLRPEQLTVHNFVDLSNRTIESAEHRGYHRSQGISLSSRNKP